MKKKFGLIGKSLAHSFSPRYFVEKFEAEALPYSYDALEFNRITDLSKEFIKQYNGLNVTIPYKSEIIPFCDELSPEAKAIGAVNTLHVHEGEIKGYNTDHIGFIRPLLSRINEIKTAVVLGTGGASKAVRYALELHGIQVRHVSRFPTSTRMHYDSLTPAVLARFDLIVNTTPLGMYPNVKEVPSIPTYAFKDNQIVYDLIYNPAETKLLRIARDKGCTTINGSEMLTVQAEESWTIWTKN